MATVVESETWRPELLELRKQDQIIAEMSAQYMPLKVEGIDDKKGLKAVHDARMIVKNTRISVEKIRVRLKEDALKWGRTVDAEAKRITKMIEPIEAHLTEEENRVEEEKERIRQAEEARKQAVLQSRLDKLTAVGHMANPSFIALMTDEVFAATLAEKTKAFNDAKEAEALAASERARIEAEAAEARRIEAEKIAKERAELEALRLAQKAEADKIAALQKAESDRLAAEQKRIDDEKAAQQRKAELEQARIDAAEKARAETEQRIAAEQVKEKAEQEAKELKARRDAEEAEATRLKAEAEKPYRIKLLGVADAVRCVDVPDGVASQKVRDVLAKAEKQIRAIANGLLAE